MGDRQQCTHVPEGSSANLPCAMGVRTVPFMWRGPQIPLAQPAGSAQRWELCEGSTGIPFFQAVLGEHACSWAKVSHVPLTQPAGARGCWDSWGAGLPCPSLGLSLVRAKLKRLKMSKPASLEPTPLPGQDPPALGLKCPYPACLQSPQCQGMCWAGVGAGAHGELVPGYSMHPTSTAASPLRLWRPRIVGAQPGTLQMAGQ